MVEACAHFSRHWSSGLICFLGGTVMCLTLEVTRGPVRSGPKSLTWTPLGLVAGRDERPASPSPAQGVVLKRKTPTNNKLVAQIVLAAPEAPSGGVMLLCQVTDGASSSALELCSSPTQAVTENQPYGSSDHSPQDLKPGRPRPLFHAVSAPQRIARSKSHSAP
jgi:hypothetical protein